MTSLYPLQEEDNSINQPSNHITKNIQRSKRHQQKTLNLTPSNTAENAHKRFFVVGVEPTLIRTINPYDVVDTIEKITGKAPVSLVNNSKTSFSIKCDSSLQASRIPSLVQLGAYLVRPRFTFASTHPKVSSLYLSLTSTTCNNSKKSFL